MYSSVELTPFAYRAILSHLVDIEERKDEIVDNFYPEPSVLREDFSCFLEDYLKKLEGLVKTVQIIDKPSREKLKGLNYLPYVIIGSTVELEGGKNSGADSYRIVSPYETTNSKKDLSYMSALGKALMLKKTEETIKLDINKEPCSYRIKSIRFE